MRIKMCEDFCKEHGFVPHAGFADIKIVGVWTNLKRFQADNPRVKALMKYPTLSRSYVRIEQGINRLPGHSTNVSEEEKKARHSMVNIFAKYTDNPRVKVLMEKRKHAKVVIKNISCITASEKKNAVTAHTKRLPKVNNQDGSETSINKRMYFHLERLTSFYESEGRFPHSGLKVSKTERQAYNSMNILRNDFSDEPEVKNLLSKKPNVSAVLQEGITLLLEFVNKTGRLPVDNQKPISGERRALATWKTLKNNYPDLPVTRKLMKLNPFGTDRLGRAILEVVEFESKWQRLPRRNKEGVDGLEKYKDYDPRMEITRKSIAQVKKWVDEHGRLPKYTKTDKEEQNMAYSLKYLRKRYSYMPEVKSLLAKAS